MSYDELLLYAKRFRAAYLEEKSINNKFVQVNKKAINAATDLKEAAQAYKLKYQSRVKQNHVLTGELQQLKQIHDMALNDLNALAGNFKELTDFTNYVLSTHRDGQSLSMEWRLKNAAKIRNKTSKFDTSLSSAVSFPLIDTSGDKTSKPVDSSLVDPKNPNFIDIDKLGNNKGKGK